LDLTLKQNIENRYLSSFACHSPQSKGRLYKDDFLNFQRTEFQRDRDRIIHSDAFRRLKHKTQVFVYHEGDHYRTRLTHTLEVAQIARSIARSLNVNEDLTETIALAHDLGHPPLGHRGEDVLNKLMLDYGGFDHNEQTIRVITKLEKKYHEFNGLNLTFETLEGLVKHNGPYIKNKKIPITIQKLNDDFPLNLSLFPSCEAQIANIADDIAYLTHDFDDGLREKLFKLNDLKNLKLPALIISKIEKKYPDINIRVLTHQLIRLLIAHFINDIVTNSLLTIKNNKFKSVDEIRNFNQPIIKMSDLSLEYMKEIRDFLFKNMYFNKDVLKKLSIASEMIEKLFILYNQNPNLLPLQWKIFKDKKIIDCSKKVKTRVISDYISGMTDVFLKLEYNKFFNEDN
jgi:dGTPase